MKSFLLVFITFGCAYAAQPGIWLNFTKTTPNAYIIDGEEAPDGAYPYMLSLNFKRHNSSEEWHACGASILTKNWALTAAHCCLTSHEIYLYSGSNSLTKGWTKHKIEAYKMHPKYAPLDMWKNDICLIKVKDPFVLGTKVKQITLPTQNMPVNDNDEVLITGWGYTSNEEGRKIPDKLQRATFKAITPQKCESLTDQNHESYLCVVNKVRGQGACGGDSGSPLVRNGVQVGIASWIYQPCGHGMPDFYARVPTFIKWITDTLGPDSSQLKFVK